MRRPARCSSSTCPEPAQNLRDGRTRCGLVFVEQDPAGRRVDVIELTGADGPHECPDRTGGDEQRERKDEVEGGHDELRSRNARERNELASTVSELAGISSAASRGWISPAAASVPAVRLYASEIRRLRLIVARVATAPRAVAAIASIEG